MLHMWGQILAICAVIACGVATFVMSLSALYALQTTQGTYYDRYRFADVFVGLKRAPNALESRLAEIPGVAHVQTRVVRDRSEEHTSELQSLRHLVCRLLLEKK